MTYTLFRWRKSDSGKIAVPWYDWCLSGLAFLLGLYHWVFETDLIQRSGPPSTIDLMAGVIVLVLLFEGARRIMGWGLPLFCLVFSFPTRCSGAPCPASCSTAASVSTR